MIIVDTAPLRKGNPPDDAEAAEAAAQPPPPAYSGYQPAQNYPSTTQIYVIPAQASRVSTTRRFFKAFLVAALIWALTGIFVRSFVELVAYSHHRRPYPGAYQNGPNWEGGHWPPPPRLPMHPHERPVKCVHGPEWTPIGAAPGTYPRQFIANTQLDLPFDSDTLFLLSRGSLSHGIVRIIEDDHVGAGDKVQVSIEVRYYSQEALSRANVCSLTRGHRENGIGIFTSDHRENRREQQLQFDVTVRLPSDAETLYIPAFETDLKLFAHYLGPLASAYTFGSVLLKTSNFPIDVQSIDAYRAKISTENAAIRGSFNVSTSLELATSNAPIEADVSLYNSQSNHATSLRLATRNGPIKAALRLYTDSLRSSFKVDATTSNSPLTITNNVSPPDSILRLSAETSNSPAHVLLASAYEGTFSVGTSLFSPVVDRNTRKEDPSGRGRERSVNVRNVRGGVVEGAVSWEPSELPRGGAGEVSLRTSNSPVTLIL
ncbi:hypothetical protein HETIRDRAFT_482614 [Heterobasidion irregulare TC 32-1]|uniref:Uncharacterized protein n=1 Tax=Heterobasidion irregulare (strain TC 32-1) TaxID=747525 RepID=W4JP20_HETIT|nr:uncharacterized protein HETIRDRAFT_482614 [Heterobasidion irregulare TC 32-1]ETW74815.1 hypothetical protein HETIRDRAFT_482614 [Heterobasidion irregulare TC 32-1]